MPRRRKGPSMARVAKTYRKTHTKPEVNHEGSRYFNEGANPYGIGDTRSRTTYKPKPMSATFGTTVGGKGATKRVKRNKL